MKLDEISFLQDTAHPGTDPLVQVCVGEDDSRVLSAQLQSDGSQVLRGVSGNLNDRVSEIYHNTHSSHIPVGQQFQTQ